MNIFTDLCNLQMTVPLHKVFDAIDGFFPLASKIRAELSDQAYLLDNYLKAVLQVLNQSDLIEATEKAQRDYMEFREVCSEIMNNEHTQHSNPYYIFIKTYLDANREKYPDEYFLRELAVAAAARNFAKEHIQKYWEVQNHKIAKRMDIVELRSMYRSISYSVGYDIERLNDMIKNQFLVAPIVDAYTQAYLNHYLVQLVTSDSVSSQLIFQAMLEEADNQ